MTVYQSYDPDNKKKLPIPNTQAEAGAPNILFTMRPLGRKNKGEILRLEKGHLMAELLDTPKGQRLVYRDGKTQQVDEEGRSITDKEEFEQEQAGAGPGMKESLEEKVFAILKEGLKISK